MGDGYRVEARIVVWKGKDVVKAAAGALFREADHWAVFLVRDGRARLQLVEVGQSNGIETEIRKGLQPGDRIVVHPSDRIQDGTRVKERKVRS